MCNRGCIIRTLTSTLEAAQKAMGDALCKVVLTKAGQATRTYGVDTTNRILSCKMQMGEWRQSAEVVVDNRDGNLTSLTLQGYQAVISKGFVTSSGDEYSAYPPMKVISQRGDVRGGEMITIFSLAGLINLLAEDKASADYTPDDTDTDTVKTIIDAVMGATLAAFNHCTAYTVTWDSEDDLIDVFMPKDSFSVYFRESRQSAIKKLLAFTKCVMRFEDDGNPHILVPRRTESAATWVANTAYSLNDMVIPTTPNNYYYVCTTAGTSHATTEPTWTTDIGDTIADGTVEWTVAYHYEYTRVSTDHNFYEKGYRRRVIDPNKITVSSHPTSGDAYTGNATDATSYALLPIEDFQHLRVASNAQATSIAEAYIAKAQAAAEQGHCLAPMNVGQEIYDYVKVTDAWSSDYREGNILYFETFYKPGQFTFGFRFGDITFGLAGTSIIQTSGGTSASISQLYSLINDIFDLIDYILGIIAEGGANALAGYIWVDASGNIRIRPKSGQDIIIYEDFDPQTTNDASFGAPNKEYVDGYIKKIYADTRCVIPVGTDMYD